MEGQIVSRSHAPREIPLPQNHLIQRLLAKNVADRSASAETVAKTLRTLKLEDATIPLPPPAPAPSPQQRNRMSKKWFPNLSGGRQPPESSEAGQEVLAPDEFEKKYGWKNDPQRVRLPSRPAP